MSDFATELAKSKNAPNIEDDPAAAVAAIENAPADEQKDVQPFLEHGAAILPAGNAPVDPKAKEVEAAAAAAAPKADDKKETEAAKPKIKIGDQEFESYEEAVEYAKQLDQARREDAAFIEGVKTAKADDKKDDEAPVEKSYIQKAQDVLFENPEEALKILKEGIEADIFKKYDEMTTEQKRAAVAKAQHDQMWNEFYTGNPELSESKEIVDFLVQKNWKELEKLPYKDALAKVADMARTQLKITKEATLPKKELHSGPVVMPGASKVATTQENSKEGEENLSFTQQLTKMRTRK